MSAIVAENVSKRFGREQRPAVDGVSFAVDEGALVVLLGPSGCGKTTLLKMINRLYEPTGGKIFVEGTEIHDLPATELRRKIGYVIQQTGLFPHMRIEQNIAVVPQLLGWNKAKIDLRVDELLDLIGLPRTFRTRYPRQLSGGQQQRVGLARALAADPAIMLMDEPFGAIDAITRTRLQDELLNIQRKVHKTILFVTHDVEEALRLADKIVIMREGRIVQYDTPLNIVTEPRDAFVQELVGTEDMLRHMSLLTVWSVLHARKDGAAPQIAPAADDGRTTVSVNENLRNVLSEMLRSGRQSLTVVNEDAQPVGHISLDDMRAAVAGHGQPVKAEA
jgi:osmoprotectant transport system ATP-binding protein